jgi:hypothetical protein
MDIFKEFDTVMMKMFHFTFILLIGILLSLYLVTGNFWSMFLVLVNFGLWITSFYLLSSSK